MQRSSFSFRPPFVIAMAHSKVIKEVMLKGKETKRRKKTRKQKKKGEERREKRREKRKKRRRKKK